MIPSLERFATHDLSQHPHQWVGSRLALAPCLGVQGPRVLDFSGWGNHGTLINMDPPTDWVSDAGLDAIDLDGVNDYVEVGDVTSLEVPRLTFSLWCRPRVVPQAAFATVAGKEWSNPRALPFVSFKFGANFNGFYSWEINVNGTNQGFQGTVAPVAGVMVFLCGTYDGEVSRFYVNGKLDSTRAASGVIQYNNGPFKLGANAANGELFNGTVDDIHLADRALSAGEVWERYQIGRGGLFAPRMQTPVVFDFGSRRRRLLVTGQT